MKDKHDVPQSERALLKEFRRRIELPDGIEEEVSRAAGQRDYVTACMLRTAKDAVSTNLVYRYMQANVADMFPRDPNFTVVPADKLWGPQGPPMAVAQESDTLERLLNFHGRTGSFKEQMRALARECYTVPMGICKLIMMEDYSRDPIGVRHNRETDEVVARYERLYKCYKSGDFDKDSADYKRLVDLSDSLRPVAFAELDKQLGLKEAPLNVEQTLDEAGNVVEEVNDPREDEIRKVAESKLVDPQYLPRVQTFMRFGFEVIEIEDFRWDWNITRYEDFWEGRWCAHRVRMTTEQIAEKWSLDEEEVAKLYGTHDDTDEDPNKFREDIEDPDSERTIDVWEMQDFDTRRVYIFTDDFPRFLDQYEPSTTWSRFFTLFPLQFFPIAGRFLGISPIDLQRPLQDEINERRTQQMQYLRASLPRTLVAAGAFGTDGAMQKVQDMGPFEMLEVALSDNLKDKFYTIKAEEVDRGWFDLNAPMTDLQVVAGRPLAAIGGSTPGVTATQTAFGAEQLSSQTSQNRVLFQDYMTLIGQAMAEMILQTTDTLTAQYIAGPGAFLDPVHQDALLGQVDLVVSTFLDGAIDRDRQLKAIKEALPLLMSMGAMPNAGAWASYIMAELLKLPIPANQAFSFAPPMGAMPPGGGTPGPEQGVDGQPMQGTPTMASLPGNAQRVQDVARSANA